MPDLSKINPANLGVRSQIIIDPTELQGLIQSVQNGHITPAEAEHIASLRASPQKLQQAVVSATKQPISLATPSQPASVSLQPVSHATLQRPTTVLGTNGMPPTLQTPTAVNAASINTGFSM